MGTDRSERLDQLMEEAVAFSVDHVHKGGIPFTALVVDGNGTVIGRGVNRVRDHHDPTAHAEVDAIRDACRTLKTPHLNGAILFASGEPCAMCYMSALYAGISQVFFAADRDEVARHGFDYRGSYGLFASDPLAWQSPRVAKLAVPKAMRPFQNFAAISRISD